MIRRVDYRVTSPVRVKVQETQTFDIGIRFEESQGSYQQCTRENVQAEDIDITLAFAVDFSTNGEKSTKKAAGDSYIGISLVDGSGKVDLSKEAVSRAAQQIKDLVPEFALEGEPLGVNIAGNGIYTLAPKGVTQEALDQFMTSVFVQLASEGINIGFVRSGGQTGLDEAGVTAAHALGIETVVRAPRGWKFRGENGKDVSDEESFKTRFVNKDYEMLAQRARRSVRALMNDSKYEEFRQIFPLRVAIDLPNPINFIFQRQIAVDDYEEYKDLVDGFVLNRSVNDLDMCPLEVMVVKGQHFYGYEALDFVNTIEADVDLSDSFKDKIRKTFSMTEEEVQHREELISKIKDFLDTRNTEFFEVSVPSLPYVSELGFGLDVHDNPDDNVVVYFGDRNGNNKSGLYIGEFETKHIEGIYNVVNSILIKEKTDYAALLSQIAPLRSDDWFKRLPEDRKYDVFQALFKAFPVGSNNHYFTKSQLDRLNRASLGYLNMGDDSILDSAFSKLFSYERDIMKQVYLESYAKSQNPELSVENPDKSLDKTKKHVRSSKKPSKGTKKGF